MITRSAAKLQFGAFFILTVLMIAGVRGDVLPPVAMTVWLWVQLGWGVWLVGSKNLSFGRLWPALVVLAVVQVAQYSFNVHQFAGTLDLLSLAYFLVLIGLVEEIWFRGVLLNQLKGPAWQIVLIGGLVFGVYHLNSGLLTVLTTFGVGCLYVSARLCGAGLISLAVVHGLMNWLNNSFYPPVGLAVDYMVFYAIFPLLVMVAAFAMLLKVNKKLS